MLKKTISALFVAFLMIIGASAEGTIFPAQRTDVDGVTRYGYLDEEGRTVLAFSYRQAGEFAECGLAAVEDDKNQTAVIDRAGYVVVDYTDAPVSVEFSDDAIAYRYADHSVYYTLEGEKIGSYAGAVGFFEDGLLLCKSPASGLYSYVLQDGSAAFEAEYKDAGAFSGGRALVLTTEGQYLAIDTAGQTLYKLESGIEPRYMTIFDEDTIVLSDGMAKALYSLSQSDYLTVFKYSEISEFHDGVAMVREGNRWGMINTAGKLLTEPTYYYLSYMGEGLYAARSADGSASAVDANGNVAYRTGSYVGGFNELRYGLSWHGTADGSLIFFKKNGGYFASLKNAENPTLLSENVVRVTQDGTLKYINLSTGNTLLEQPKTFDLGSGITAKTVHYEKFMGYQADGTEHGWNVDFPEISGLSDAKVQKTINDAIRAFFLKGPAVSAEYEALEGSYGASVEGSVLVVWASCISGQGAGSSVWNDSLAFDLRTGEQYEINDLLVSGYMDTVKQLLPEEHEIYLYSFPRMSTKGVTYYYNEYESETSRAYTESYLLTFEQLGDAVNQESACYQALITSLVKPTVTVSGFTDVHVTHWAAEYIRTVAEKGLMQGSGGKFRPDEYITQAEVCATMARNQSLEADGEDSMEGIDETAWYAGEVNAVWAAGLLDGLEADFQPNSVMTRADAAQLFANVLVQQGAALPDEKTTEETLASFNDAAEIPQERRAAVVLCMQKGLIKGYTDGYFRPERGFTRAEFAKLLTLI